MLIGDEICKTAHVTPLHTHPHYTVDGYLLQVLVKFIYDLASASRGLNTVIKQLHGVDPINYNLEHSTVHLTTNQSTTFIWNSVIFDGHI